MGLVQLVYLLEELLFLFFLFFSEICLKLFKLRLSLLQLAFNFFLIFLRQFVNLLIHLLLVLRQLMLVIIGFLLHLEVKRSQPVF